MVKTFSETSYQYNKPEATMRPDCVSACIEFGGRLGWTDRWKDIVSREALKTFLRVFDLIRDIIAAEKCQKLRFSRRRNGHSDGRTDGRTDGQTDRQTDGKTDVQMDEQMDRLMD